MSSVPDGSLQHLFAELARIDLRIRRQVELWQRAGQDPSDAFRGLYISDAQADALLARPLAAHWGDLTAPDPAEARAWSLAEGELAAQAAALAESGRAAGRPPRLELLAQAFGLSRFEVDALLICLAPALDLRYERLYGYLQDDVTRKRPSVGLILDLLTPPGPERLLAQAHFDEGAPLLRHHLLAQRSGNEPAELDDETANRINRERGGGQALDAGVAAQAGAALGHDFSGVRVHTSPEADSLSRALGALAFTTGRDIFFREGAYAPHSASGQELLGHELAHVVQQSGSGASAGRMTVNPPGDAYEQEAERAAKALLGSTPASVQRQEPEPEEDQEEKVQTQEDEEEQVP